MLRSAAVVALRPATSQLGLGILKGSWKVLEACPASAGLLLGCWFLGAATCSVAGWAAQAVPAPQRPAQRAVAAVLEGKGRRYCARRSRLGLAAPCRGCCWPSAPLAAGHHTVHHSRQVVFNVTPANIAVRPPCPGAAVGQQGALQPARQQHLVAALEAVDLQGGAGGG